MRSLKFILTIFSLALLTQSHAAIDPVYKECMQRGYTVEGDSCVMPDGSKCLLEDFNSGDCGKTFFDEPYCVPEGEYVWDEDKCCEGLWPFLEEDTDGQQRCEIEPEWYTDAFGSPAFWVLAVLIWGGIFYLVFRKK